MISVLARLIPWSTVLLIAAGVVVVQALGVDVIGMVGDWLATQFDLSWSALAFW